ncbi:putative DNA methylase [Podospora australis]|uniref:DNA (cytosine-5-)-methyltransferase n=1 Tax=Podospora australis TaxID=1536484 RepID=A0AAN6X1M0_9PEZI|nr:putative DNA methylase [Podospora australis]
MTLLKEPPWAMPRGQEPFQVVAQPTTEDFFGSEAFDIFPTIEADENAQCQHPNRQLLHPGLQELAPVTPKASRTPPTPLQSQLAEVLEEPLATPSPDDEYEILLGQQEAVGWESSPSFEPLRSQNVFVDLPKSTLVTPRSQHEGFIPPAHPSDEREALKDLLAVMKEAEAGAQEQEAGTAELGEQHDYVEFELSQFTFYVANSNYPCEMRPLHNLDTLNRKGEKYYFDGVLSFGSVRRFVQQVQVAELPIDNYGVENPTVAGRVWVRSLLNSRKEIYYLLRQPAIEYVRFYTPFLWIVDFAKHVVDYSGSLVKRGRDVSLELFKKSFNAWLEKQHGSSLEFQAWREQYPSDDFRVSVVANMHFIWKEMNGVIGSKANSLKLFRETVHFNQYKMVTAKSPVEVSQGQDTTFATTVTPYIDGLFGHMVIGKVLNAVGNAEAEEAALLATNQLVGHDNGGFQTSKTYVGRRRKPCFVPLDVIDNVQVGDVISTPPDGESTDTKWKKMASEGAVDDNRWFGLVQRIHVAKDGFRSFDVTWLYRPVETPCCMMKYPWQNELFLSDHCTCQENVQSRWKENEVLGVHQINWFGGPKDSKGELFVRQMYIVEHRRWITLQESHLRCAHSDEEALKFRTGDAVLASSSADDEFVDPYEVVKIFKQGRTVFVRLRKLLRRSKIQASARAPPNELVYTDKFVVVKPSKIAGKCSVRFFAPDETIPSPYNRDGTGNLFFITHKLDAVDGHAEVVPFEGEFPASLRQGFDPRQQGFTKLKGMDLFCGSGNFGRGLEEGGAVDMLWANDIWDKAIHTYMANSPHPEASPFLGSVDDFLKLALQGKYSKAIPRPGEVDFIAAGSPCPGFSLLTRDKSTLAQKKNQSLVASFASFVDFYRPKYAVLENVSNIVQAHQNRAQDTLSQLFCAVVGLGYQAQLIFGDSWRHGAPQCRNRVFLFVAAPGLRLPEAPAPSHSHFRGAKSRNLGELCNGEPYIQRSFDPAPFRFRSASEATVDLPRIDDGKPNACIAAPDHRIIMGVTAKTRPQLAAIPTHPFAMNFVKAWKDGNGVMTRAEWDGFRNYRDKKESFRMGPLSQGWSRLSPRDVFRTVTTQCQVSDARMSGLMHWFDLRPMSLMEVRRAQGFRDEEVLLGTLPDKWKLVGNSVSRHMSLALGLKLREAWIGSLMDEKRKQGRGSTRGVSESVTGAAISVRGMSATAVDLTVAGEHFGEEKVVLKVDNSDGRKRSLTPDVSVDGDENYDHHDQHHPAKIQRVMDDGEEKMSEKCSLAEGLFVDEEYEQHKMFSMPSRSAESEMKKGPTIVRIQEKEEEYS